MERKYSCFRFRTFLNEPTLNSIRHENTINLYKVSVSNDKTTMQKWYVDCNFMSQQRPKLCEIISKAQKGPHLNFNCLFQVDNFSVCMFQIIVRYKALYLECRWICKENVWRKLCDWSVGSWCVRFRCKKLDFNYEYPQFWVWRLKNMFQEIELF